MNLFHILAFTRSLSSLYKLVQHLDSGNISSLHLLEISQFRIVLSYFELAIISNKVHFFELTSSHEVLPKFHCAISNSCLQRKFRISLSYFELCQVSRNFELRCNFSNCPSEEISNNANLRISNRVFRISNWFRISNKFSSFGLCKVSRI